MTTMPTLLILKIITTIIIPAIITTTTIAMTSQEIISLEILGKNFFPESGDKIEELNKIFKIKSHRWKINKSIMLKLKY